MEFLKQGNPSAPPTTSKTVVSNPNPREETHVSNLDIVTNGLRFGICIGNWDYELGIRIWDSDWELGIGIGD